MHPTFVIRRSLFALGPLAAALLVCAAPGCDDLRSAPSDASAETPDVGSSPADGATPIGSDGAADGATSSGGSDGGPLSDATLPDSSGPTDGATRDVDRAWAAWPLPPPSPAAANYSILAASVRDETTHLVWERTVRPMKRTWQQGRDYCDTLVLDGQSDWRLPKRIELISLVDYGAASPAINAVAFPGTAVDLYWTDSLDAANSVTNPTYKAWVVDFSDGTIGPIPSDGLYPVRCVRGG